MGLRGEGVLANGHGTGRGNAPKTKDSGDGGAKGPAPDMTRREAADYIAGMLGGLHSIAHRADLSFIAYLLAMALEEAQAEKVRDG